MRRTIYGEDHGAFRDRARRFVTPFAVEEGVPGFHRGRETPETAGRDLGR
ncbi:hypothetical protein [Microbispora bryophytorum]|uniref:Acyl-CoA dehydrogenase n=1 Tax=Microbispora bryophytorum TaxID=1460882 RepID=A0A8H9GZ48_9ACTN|nr:hypothetical protein [Microbispora bryophytorum]MBD3134742.1 hypothetical protein [Microbispora bryophytorum]GGO12541.1 hypothetical protein GCM10011574_31110 [Microbispora bryophytorum]